MGHTIIVSNGKLRILVVPKDDIERMAFKTLDGATVRLVNENLRVLDTNISGALVLEAGVTAAPQEAEAPILAIKD